MSEAKKYYWLKLKRDFFKRHDIQIIEAMPNGKDYILFYLKLLCESVNHEGNLRFSDSIPYNDGMLATITNTNIDIVRSAIQVFTELQMMDKLDDGTLFMIETQKMVGCETEWAKKKREYRSKMALEDKERTKKDNVRQEIEKELEIEKEIDKDINTKKSKPKPKKTIYGTYKHVRLTDDEYKRLIEEYGQDATEKAITFLDEYTEEKGYKCNSHNLALRRWVFDAVKEREQKQAKQMQQARPTNKFNNFSNQKYTSQEISELERQLLAN